MKWAIKNDLLLWFLCFGPCALSGGEKLCVCVCVYTHAGRIFVFMYLCAKSVMSWNKEPSQSQFIPAAVSLELHP